MNFPATGNYAAAALFDEILLRVGDVPAQSKIRADQETLITLYRERGYPDVSISFQLEDSDTDNTQALSFFITEGIQTNIRSIVFSGINFATENQLRALIISKQQGLFDSGVFQESNFELDRQAILNFYGESGYIDAQVLDIAQELVEDQTSELKIFQTYLFY